MVAKTCVKVSNHSLSHSCMSGFVVQIEQVQSQCCQLEKELARKQGDADVFRREAENKLAERMRVALREQQLEYESQVMHGTCLELA